MKLAIAYSTKDQIELTEQTLNRLCDTQADFDIYWIDGSRADEGLKLFADYCDCAFHSERVVGGADAAIAWKLTKLLSAMDYADHGAAGFSLRPKYTHIMLLENDVLLDEDWFEPTLQLFEKGKADGLEVGAVSPRSYVDRVLIQRDGYACMHNIGAGVVVFTREAAKIVLRSFRTHWWPDNVKAFAQVSGIDLRTYAAFRGQEHFVTTDWGWEAQLAAHGLASLALTPAKCQMIGQNPPLEQQGLTLTRPAHDRILSKDHDAFPVYQTNLAALRGDRFQLEIPDVIHRDGAGMLFFPHQLGYLAGGPTWAGTLELQWSQAFGPFVYRAGPGGASLSVRISGSCSFLVSGGAAGAQVVIEDRRSGFKVSPNLPPDTDRITISVPGGPVPRQISCAFAEGAIFHGLSTADPQMLDATFSFDWTQLPSAY